MKVELHPKHHLVKINCASCGSNVEVLSTLKAKESTIDICGSCHPFYIGSRQQTSTKGRAEKFSSKVETAKANSKETKLKDVKLKVKKQAKTVSSFEEL